MLTMGSLFDGMAGFPLAFAQAGVVTRWLVELEEDCRRVSARHFPEARAAAVLAAGDVLRLGRGE